MKEDDLLEFRLRMEALITLREGMIAENKQREHLQQRIAYGEKAFEEIDNSMLRILSDLRHAQRRER